MSNTWDKFRLWLSGVGAFIFEFTGTSLWKMIKEYGPIAGGIVVEVSMLSISGNEKHALAVGKLMALIPEIKEKYFAEAIIKSEYEMWIKREEKIDTDGDGIPDYRDLCKLLGDQGCGVDENGCPIPCEPDCTDTNEDGICDKDQCFDSEGKLIECPPEDCPDGTC